MTSNNHNNPSILDRIVAAKRKRIARDKTATPLGTMVSASEEANRECFPLAFDEAITSRSSVSVIAEMKRSSPSAGVDGYYVEPPRNAPNYCRARCALLYPC